MKCYTITVSVYRGGVSMIIPFTRFYQVLRGLPGFLAWTEHSAEGLAVVAFGTRTHAEKARARLGRLRYRCGKYIMDADYEQEKQLIRVHGPVDGWDSVDPKDLAHIIQ